MLSTPSSCCKAETLGFAMEVDDQAQAQIDSQRIHSPKGA